MPAISLLRPDDAKRVSDLHIKAFAPKPGWQETDFQDLLNLPTVFAPAIEIAGALAAFILLQRLEQDVEVLTLAVSTSHRRQGMSRHLFVASDQLCQQKGLSRYLLEVGADNEAACALYATLGFQRDGVRKNYYKALDGTRIDAILMSRPVAGQQTS